MTPLREYAAETGMLAMPHEGAVQTYENACERFGADGDRPALMRALLSISVAPQQIRWHLARPGRRLPCVYGD